MKVRAIKAKYDDVWYYNDIGKIFEVEEKLYMSTYYLLKNRPYETIRGFRISDVKVTGRII